MGLQKIRPNWQKCWYKGLKVICMHFLFWAIQLWTLFLLGSNWGWWRLLGGECEEAVLITVGPAIACAWIICGQHPLNSKLAYAVVFLLRADQMIVKNELLCSGSVKFHSSCQWITAGFQGKQTALVFCQRRLCGRLTWSGSYLFEPYCQELSRRIKATTAKLQSI